MAYVFRPGPDWRRVFRRGDSGWDVAALQVNFLGLPVDGHFGSLTSERVRRFQADQDLRVDGIAGPLTQQALCMKHSRRYEEGLVPRRLLVSIAANESGCALAAYAGHGSDLGYDLGWLQFSTAPNATQAAIVSALAITMSAAAAVERLRATYERFQAIGVAPMTKRRLWELVVLSWNWPYAAERLVRGLSIYQDPTRDDEPQAWVERVTGGRLHTAREWCASYIEKATTLVDWASLDGLR